MNGGSDRFLRCYKVFRSANHACNLLFGGGISFSWKFVYEVRWFVASSTIGL